MAGRFGVGKSHIINSVLKNELGMEHILKYKVGRNPLSLVRFLFTGALEQQPPRAKLLQSIKMLGSKNLTFPYHLLVKLQ